MSVFKPVSYCLTDQHREYYRPDILSYFGDYIHFDLSQGIHNNTAVTVSVNHTIPEQNTFRVYRVKLHQTEDLQEDGLAKCRDYSPHFTYHDCTLASIDQVDSDSVE